MKTSVCLLAVLVSVCSFAVGVSTLPASEFDDTEVSTNFTFSVGERSNRRLVFSLELEATPTNNVEIAVEQLRELVEGKKGADGFPG